MFENRSAPWSDYTGMKMIKRMMNMAAAAIMLGGLANFAVPVTD
jgi:hypothetical protein